MVTQWYPYTQGVCALLISVRTQTKSSPWTRMPRHGLPLAATRLTAALPPTLGSPSANLVALKGTLETHHSPSTGPSLQPAPVHAETPLSKEGPAVPGAALPPSAVAPHSCVCRNKPLWVHLFQPELPSSPKRRADFRTSRSNHQDLRCSFKPNSCKKQLQNKANH